VDVRTPEASGERASALRRRLQFDADPDGVQATFRRHDEEVAARLARHARAALPDELVEAVAALCASVGAEGLRADLTICRAAAALAGWEGRLVVEASDVRRVAPLALAHRARRDPLDPAGHDRERLEQSLDEHLGEPEERSGTAGTGERTAEAVESGPPPLPHLTAVRGPTAEGRRRPAPGNPVASGRRGRMVGDRAPDGPVTSVAVGATVRHAVARRSGQAEGAPLVEPGDVRQAVHEHRTANMIVIAVDASGSMGAATRMETAKGTVLGLLRDAYQRRDRVALVAFRGERAEVLLRPTSSVEVARARLAELPTGGRTPLGEGLRAALDLAQSPAGAAGYRPLLVVITDGRATSAPGDADPLEWAAGAAEEIRRAGVASVVIDVEGAGSGPGVTRLGLAARLAAGMGASHVPVEELTPTVVEAAVRGAALR
jgi:magnesium chelatase subunit D